MRPGGEAGRGAVEEFAPAKINLALHVTGRRADGYHLLDSLVAFAGVGDSLIARPTAGATRLTIEGPMAAGLEAGDGNLVMRAARHLGVAADMTLVKRLPVASGIGGGSADAAAAVRALCALSGRALPPAASLSTLGADVPVCLAAPPRAMRMTGIGEGLAPAPPLPPAWLVLANPGVGVPTAAVFAALAGRSGPALPPLPENWPDAAALAAWIRAGRNDLEAPALRVAPVIGGVLAALTALRGALVARMSGSGATAFAVFADEASAGAGAAALRDRWPGWWVVAAPLLCG